MRSAPVARCGPDLECAAAVRGPQDPLTVRGEGGVPVLCTVVRQLAELAAFELELPQVEIPCAIRGKANARPVTRIDRLAVARFAFEQIATAPARRRDHP